MNANTALRINDAIDQAIHCGESVEDVRRQVRTALARALDERATEQLRRFDELDGVVARA